LHHLLIANDDARRAFDLDVSGQESHGTSVQSA
jgi:hypothetical protein